MLLFYAVSLKNAINHNSILEKAKRHRLISAGAFLSKQPFFNNGTAAETISQYKHFFDDKLTFKANTDYICKNKPKKQTTLFFLVSSENLMVTDDF